MRFRGWLFGLVVAVAAAGCASTEESTALSSDFVDSETIADASAPTTSESDRSVGFVPATQEVLIQWIEGEVSDGGRTILRAVEGDVGTRLQLTVEEGEVSFTLFSECDRPWAGPTDGFISGTVGIGPIGEVALSEVAFDEATFCGRNELPPTWSSAIAGGATLELEGPHLMLTSNGLSTTYFGPYRTAIPPTFDRDDEAGAQALDEFVSFVSGLSHSLVSTENPDLKIQVIAAASDGPQEGARITAMALIVNRSTPPWGTRWGLLDFTDESEVRYFNFLDPGEVIDRASGFSSLSTAQAPESHHSFFRLIDSEFELRFDEANGALTFVGEEQEFRFVSES